MKTHSVYDLSGINNWTKEDEAAKRKNYKGEVAEKKTDAFSIYDATTFPVLISNPTNDNVANRNLMLAQFEKLTKVELDLLVNKAKEEFSMMINCPRWKRTHSRCMYPAITTMLVELQMKMRQADSTEVTQLVIDKWSETVEKVYDAYQREWVETSGACDRVVEAKRDKKMTWVCAFSGFPSLVQMSRKLWSFQFSRKQC
jgi:hypothetical protein